MRIMEPCRLPLGLDGSSFRTLLWELSQDDLAAQSQHSILFYTGLAFQHEARPFYIKIKIQGRLRKVTDQIKSIFPPRAKPKQGTALMLIGIDSSYNSGDPLDSFARGLKEDMLRKNREAVSRRVPTTGLQNLPPPPYERDEIMQAQEAAMTKTAEELEAGRGRAASIVEKLALAPEVYSSKDASGFA
ncbi:hypothetical protein CMQ_3270 [Grosmannia clavigera kw1407]|uniref:Uncharacterized protein n=1 Tax=Grosmannia clavigera (strain kw1407 / UAMH 11150) TaxID=655863 RepID=F0X8A3_GROCL|nr:uncharacterized protein CMQ_3270 [Grosmannia clavigera kw1407]EFX05201.1 hypothetical protein CMQ_3270 [Grosmannia clavigera kw1407]